MRRLGRLFIRAFAINLTKNAFVQYTSGPGRRVVVSAAVRGADGGGLEHRGAAQAGGAQPAASDGRRRARGSRPRVCSRGALRRCRAQTIRHT